MSWWQLFIEVFHFFEYAIIVYIAAVNTIYVLRMIIGFVDLRRYPGNLTVSEPKALLRSRSRPPFQSLPRLQRGGDDPRQRPIDAGSPLPRHTVIVINDGSTDDTLQILIDEFQLYKSSCQCAESIPTKPIRGIYESKVLLPLIVENIGFRQLLTVWRVKGLIDGLRGKKGWGKMERCGFRPSAGS